MWWVDDAAAVIRQIGNWVFNFLVALGMVGAVGIFALYSAGFFHWIFK